jgi:small subunit ribosomal protein S20
MANTASAIKRIRQTQRRDARNQRSASRLKTQVRKLKQALDGSDAASAKDLLKPTISVVDKSVQKGVLKKNTASRIKSRLTRRVRALAPAKA